MKWYHRALSGVLAASMGVGLLGSLPQAAAVSSVSTGKMRSERLRQPVKFRQQSAWIIRFRVKNYRKSAQN